VRRFFSLLALLGILAVPLSGGTEAVRRGHQHLEKALEGRSVAARRSRRPRRTVVLDPALARPALDRLEVQAADRAPLGRLTKARKVRELLLTFDDGPDLEGTPLILDELDRRGLKAIFFVNGQHMVGDRPHDFALRELVRRIATRGHLVANHTLSHRNVCAEKELLEAEIDGNAEIIAAATGVRPQLFRSPYGARCRALREALAERDLLQVGWNIDPQEWKGATETAITQYVARRLGGFAGRAILLLHDTRREAVRALPRILDWIEEENRQLLRAGESPIVIRDYRVFFPSEPLPETGLEPFWQELRGTGDLGDLLPAGFRRPQAGVVLGMR